MSKNKQTNKQTNKSKQNKTKNLSKIFQGLHLRSVKISPILSYPEFFRSFLTSLVFFSPNQTVIVRCLSIQRLLLMVSFRSSFQTNFVFKSYSGLTSGMRKWGNLSQSRAIFPRKNFLKKEKILSNRCHARVMKKYIKFSR